jgi:hypothetical protein
MSGKPDTSFNTRLRDESTVGIETLDCQGVDYYASHCRWVMGAGNQDIDFAITAAEYAAPSKGRHILRLLRIVAFTTTMTARATLNSITREKLGTAEVAHRHECDGRQDRKCGKTP